MIRDVIFSIWSFIFAYIFITLLNEVYKQTKPNSQFVNDVSGGRGFMSWPFEYGLNIIQLFSLQTWRSQANEYNRK